MKRNATPENFERFLKDSADELRMRPTVDVWGRIENRLNRRRRWVYFTSGFFLLTASLFGYLIVDHSGQHTSDPFAGISTVAKKTTASTDAIQSAAAPVTTTVPATRPAQHATYHPQQRTAQLFQNPILATTNTETPANGLATAATGFMMTPVDEHQPFEKTATATATTRPVGARSAVPSIESVVNLYKPKSGRRKPEFQLYFTPTISYRRLTENKSYLRAVPRNLATFNLAALYDVNSMVTHKPDMGLEMGFAFKFPVTHAVKVRTGMQFNITRYSIKAFTYDVPERATIALNNRARGVDSVNTMSRYRNYIGGRTDWLQNFYFQASAPVGVEVALNPAKKTRFGIAGTIQPTYVLGDRAYLLSTDYKNYSQVPWLIRRWNVNTSLETFVSYSSGTLRWQIGPQVRYQLLSSFIEQYPVKENLFDFGIKVGVSMDKK